LRVANIIHSVYHNIYHMGHLMDISLGIQNGRVGIEHSSRGLTSMMSELDLVYLHKNMQLSAV
jgi:hypothetical protein